MCLQVKHPETELNCGSSYSRGQNFRKGGKNMMRCQGHQKGGCRNMNPSAGFVCTFIIVLCLVVRHCLEKERTKHIIGLEAECVFRLNTPSLFF